MLNKFVLHNTCKQIDWLWV